MFMSVTFVATGKDDKTKEIQAVINTNSIRMIVENKENPETCMISFIDDTPSGLIKGSYEKLSKVLLGFNRKTA